MVGTSNLKTHFWVDQGDQTARSSTGHSPRPASRHSALLSDFAGASGGLPAPVSEQPMLGLVVIA